MAHKRNSDIRRFRIFERALWQKARKYILSGLVIVGIGSIAIGISLLLDTGPLVGGLGAITVLIGLIRVLIGFIRPASPGDLAPEDLIPESPQEELHEIIFHEDALAQEEERRS